MICKNLCIMKTMHCLYQLFVFRSVALYLPHKFVNKIFLVLQENFVTSQERGTRRFMHAAE